MLAEQILSKKQILVTFSSFLEFRDVGSCMNSCIQLCSAINASVDLWTILGRRKAPEERCVETEKMLLPAVIDAEKKYRIALDALSSIKVPEEKEIAAMTIIPEPAIQVQKLIRVTVALINTKAPREWNLIVDLVRDSQQFVRALSDHVHRCKEGSEVRLFVTVDKLIKVMKSSSMQIDNFQGPNSSCIPLHNFITSMMSYENAKAEMRSAVCSWKLLCRCDSSAKSKQEMPSKVPTPRNIKSSPASKLAKPTTKAISSSKRLTSPKPSHSMPPKQVTTPKHSTIVGNTRRPSSILKSPIALNDSTGKSNRSNSVPGISSPSVITMPPPQVSPSLTRKPAAGGMAALRLELADSKKDIARYARELEEVSNIARVAKENVEAQSQQIAQLLETKLKVEEDLQAKETNITNLSAELVNAKNALALKVDELESIRSDLTSLSVKLEISEQHNIQLTEQLTQANTHIENQAIEIKDLHNHIRNAKVSMEADIKKQLTMERQRFEDALTFKTKQMEQIGHEHAYIIEAKDKKIEQVEKEKMVFVENVTQAERRVQLAIQEKQKLSLEVNDHLDTIKTLREEIIALKKEKEMYEKGDFYKTHCIGLPREHFENRPEKENHHDNEKHYDKEDQHLNHSSFPQVVVLNNA